MAYLKYYDQHAIECKVSLWSLGAISDRGQSCFYVYFNISNNALYLFISTGN